MDKLIREIQNEIFWCMIFADNIVLIDGTRKGVDTKLKRCTSTLEAKGFKLSRSKPNTYIVGLVRVQVVL